MLNDALILDPWRDTREVWISARTDQFGSGTQSDPYSGGKRFTSTLPVVLAWDSASPFAVQVTATPPVKQSPHSYAVGDVITLSGSNDPAYNGSFAVESFVNSTTFNITLRTQPGSAPTGSPLCFKTIFLFDQVMRGLSANARIHIGPGTFETQGAGEGADYTSGSSPLAVIAVPNPKTFHYQATGLLPGASLSR